LGPGHTPVEEREARSHEQYERRTREHPGGGAAIDLHPMRPSFRIGVWPVVPIAVSASRTPLTGCAPTVSPQGAAPVARFAFRLRHSVVTRRFRPRPRVFRIREYRRRGVSAMFRATR